MIMKYVAGLIAITLFAIFCGAILVKMKDWALATVIVIGFVMMAVDLYQSVRRNDD
jgi:membrane-associated protease RseP (regulator of RpoE activity)